jgi:hypothetical protein
MSANNNIKLSAVKCKRKSVKKCKKSKKILPEPEGYIFKNSQLGGDSSIG